MIMDFFEENYLLLRYKQFLRFVFYKLTKSSRNIFVLCSDLITVDIQLFGIHEPLLTKIISYFNKEGFNDFFLDVGANIGISTCQNGNDFKEVHLFEPNPLCRNIAFVNISVSLENDHWTLHPFGLGSNDYTGKLRVPKNNWGGGYIVGNDNSYDNLLLLNKEGQKIFKKEDYLEYQVLIKETYSTILNLFKELVKGNKQNGVIKIDVEGMEPVILAGIAEALLEEIKVVIIFENFNEKLDFLEIINSFKGRATGYFIDIESPFNYKDFKLIKLFKLLFKRKIKYKLMPFEKRYAAKNRDLILVIS